MQVTRLSVPDVVLMKPRVFGDARGVFYESFNQRAFNDATGTSYQFVQDNHSRSRKGVLRGLHYQLHQPQGKLVRVVQGVVFDVAVDLRKSSPTFGRWVGEILSAENQALMWVPPGFAHGFLTLSDTSDFVYKTTDYWCPEDERIIRWNDPLLSIDWPISIPPFLAEKDAVGSLMDEADLYD